MTDFASRTVRDRDRRPMLYAGLILLVVTLAVSGVGLVVRLADSGRLPRRCGRSRHDGHRVRLEAIRCGPVVPEGRAGVAPFQGRSSARPPGRRLGTACGSPVTRSAPSPARHRPGRSHAGRPGPVGAVGTGRVPLPLLPRLRGRRPATRAHQCRSARRAPGGEHPATHAVAPSRAQRHASGARTYTTRRDVTRVNRGGGYCLKRGQLTATGT